MLKREIDKFIESFKTSENILKTMNLHKLKENLHKSFFDDVPENAFEEPEEIENSENDKDTNNFPQTAEKFRFEKEFSTSKIRKSIESHSILSNLSLQDVFNSTNKKLLDKNSHIFHEPNGNIILEEDSNFNLNTFNLKTNFNNFEFEYANVEDNNMQYSEDFRNNRKNDMKLENIQGEILNFLKR